jgi:hypothetical protein
MSDHKSPDERGFDWGPPAGSHTDLFKEWTVYLFLFLLIGGGIWLLIEPGLGRENKGFPLPPEPAVPAGTTAVPAAPGGQQPAAAPAVSQPQGPVYMIQLGVFGDEESAKLAYQKLKSLGFSGSVALPDDHFEMYRLLVGPFREENEAESMARRLNELDFPCFVIESQ